MLPIVGVIVIIGVIVFVIIAINKKKKGESLGENNRR